MSRALKHPREGSVVNPLLDEFENLENEDLNAHRINRMEEILDTANQKMDALEESIADLKAYQSKIQELEAYYTSSQWKEDFAMDEAGKLPKNLKRGVLSEDGIYNALERNKELLELLDGFDD